MVRLGEREKYMTEAEIGTEKVKFIPLLKFSNI